MIALDPWLLLAFLPASLALNLTPGADMMFCLGQGLRGGARAGIAASAGVALGGVIHAALAGLGLGALVAALPFAFDAIRWAGVTYLLWLALATLHADPAEAVRPPARGALRAFRDGLVVNLTNPKVILFMLAFVPQFIDPARPVFAQFMLLGAALALGGLVINGAVGVFAAGLRLRLGAGGRAARWAGRLSAAIYAGLALRLVFLEKG